MSYNHIIDLDKEQEKCKTYGIAELRSFLLKMNVRFEPSDKLAKLQKLYSVTIRENYNEIKN